MSQTLEIKRSKNGLFIGVMAILISFSLLTVWFVFFRGGTGGIIGAAIVLIVALPAPPPFSKMRWK